MTYTKMIDGENVAMTDAEISERQNDEAKWAQGTRERLLKDVRKQRNALIAESDYTVLEDSPKTNKEEWMTYRQALRDITKNISESATDISEIIFPEIPN